MYKGGLLALKSIYCEGPPSHSQPRRHALERRTGLRRVRSRLRSSRRRRMVKTNRASFICRKMCLERASHANA